MNELLAIAMGKQAGGVQPQGEIEITENGEYDVAEYATANVNVKGGAEISISTPTITVIPPTILPPLNVNLPNEGVSVSNPTITIE